MLDDELIVETPERVQLHYVLASLGNRFLAALIDHLIQFGVAAAVLALVANIMSWRALSSMQTWAAALVVIAIFALYWGYFVFFETLWSGQTPGKRIMRLRVIREDGRPVRFFEVMVRNIFRLALDFLPPPSYAIGVVCMALTQRSKRLGDLVAGTVVVKERAAEAPSLEDIMKTIELNSKPAQQVPPMALDLKRLGERELRAVEAFLNRRYELPGPVRESSALRIAAAISAKLGAPLEGISPEAFLEEVSRQSQIRQRPRGGSMMRRTNVFFLMIVLAMGRLAAAQQKLLTLDDIYDPAKRINFSGSPKVGLRWSKDGLHYLETRRDPSSGAIEILKVNAMTGQASPLYSPAKLEAALRKLPGISQEDAKWIAGQGIYQMNPAQTAALIKHANDLFYYEFGGESALRLTNTPEEELEADFSPDGRMVSFVRGNNLYVVDIATGRERALTSDGNQKILNGRLDWVYQEELYGRGNFRAYWWSPDSTKIAYLRLDETEVREFAVVDHIPRLQELEIGPYPKAGDPNPKVSLGVVSAAGGATRWINNFRYQSVDFLISRVDWTPDGKKIAYQVQDREQRWLDLVLADAATGNSQVLFRETTKAWVEVIDNPKWLSDGSFLWLSERSGYKHIYHYSAEGRLIRQVTDGKWEVRSLHGVDEGKGLVYFSGTEGGPTELHAYRIKLDGAGLERLTREAGSHQVNFNPTLTHYIDNWSDVNTPIQVRLYSADGSLVRTIDENRVEALKQYKLGKVEFLQVKARDGFVLEAMMIKPPDFDPGKKYPVLCYVYGGPQAPQVRNAWGGPTYMWHQMLAQKGYIIWICDNRSASGKGAESSWPIYRNFGQVELQDLEDSLNWLRSQPYVDGSRIGIWGWSFGGYMTAYAMTHSKSFKVGISGAPVTDWRLYDSIYTERYMGTPQNNPEGYEKSSALRAAANLHGKLLIIHGTMDDNVHLQNTIQFAYELQKAGKQFRMMLYPRSRHGVADPLLVKHMRAMMTEFILENL